MTTILILLLIIKFKQLSDSYIALNPSDLGKLAQTLKETDISKFQPSVNYLTCENYDMLGANLPSTTKYMA